jgi:hypothetical protein
MREKVAIVDDDASVRRSLKRLVEVAGFPVNVYGSGEDLLKDDLDEVACAVLDVNLGGISGIETGAVYRPNTPGHFGHLHYSGGLGRRSQASRGAWLHGLSAQANSRRRIDSRAPWLHRGNGPGTVSNVTGAARSANEDHAGLSVMEEFKAASVS